MVFLFDFLSVETFSVTLVIKQALCQQLKTSGDILKLKYKQLILNYLFLILQHGFWRDDGRMAIRT